MKQYQKEGIIKYANQIVVIKDNMQIINPTEEEILADGWKEYVYVPEPEKPVLEPSDYAIQRATLALMFPKAKEEFSKLDDQEALRVKELADTWYSKIGTEVETGIRLFYDNRLCKVRQKHLVQEQYPPSLETASLYEFIDVEHAGTQDDPIPYIPPMAIFEGKYYIQKDVLYKCTRDSGIPLSHDLEDLVGQYVEKVD